MRYAKISHKTALLLCYMALRKVRSNDTGDTMSAVVLTLALAVPVGAGWPREVALPGLPQIRSCAIDATGSSVHGFAARRSRDGITADGSG